MNYQDEINKLRWGIQDDIMKYFERKNSTIKPKSVNFVEPYPMIIRDSSGTDMDFIRIHINGISSTRKLLLQGGKEITMDELSVEQMVSLKSKMTEGNLEYRF